MFLSKTVDKKHDLRIFCRWSNLSRFTRFWGDQSDHKFAVGGPQLILRAGPPDIFKQVVCFKCLYLVWFNFIHCGWYYWHLLQMGFYKLTHAMDSTCVPLRNFCIDGPNIYSASRNQTGCRRYSWRFLGNSSPLILGGSSRLGQNAKFFPKILGVTSLLGLSRHKQASTPPSQLFVQGTWSHHSVTTIDTHLSNNIISILECHQMCCLLQCFSFFVSPQLLQEHQQLLLRKLSCKSADWQISNLEKT